MNKDPEAIQKLLNWLLRDPDSPCIAPSGESNQGQPLDSSEFSSPVSVDPLEFLDPEEDSASLPQFDAIDPASDDYLSYELGDLPAVQDRFHALLKRRLRVEIEQNPPLFPWETSMYDYGNGAVADATTPELVPAGFWKAQLRNLNLPIPIPEPVLETLLLRCQSLLHSTLREGAKLVEAVEGLFPAQPHTLNQVAGWVMASPARSGDESLIDRIRAAQPNFPSTYETANINQQIAISLIAAREILSAFTLTVSASQPSMTKRWQTPAGWITLDVNYQPSGRLRVVGHLPVASRMTLKDDFTESVSERTATGDLCVELLQTSVNHAYSLEVVLNGVDRPLQFAIRIEDNV